MLLKSLTEVKAGSTNRSVTERRFKTMLRKKILWIIPFIVFSMTQCGGKQVSSSLSGYNRGGMNLYSKSTDVKLGEQVLEAQLKEFKKKGVGVDAAKDRALKSRVEKIMRRLAAVSDEPSFPYEVHIVDEPKIVNAFSLPGGKMVVFTGLFDKEKGLVNIKDDNQIAAVMGHEMAHATLRHVTRQLTQLQGLSLIGTAASIGLGQGVGGGAQQVFEQVFSLGVNLYLPSYSRKFESAADQAGLYYMSRAKFNPQAAVDIWRKAAQRGGANSDKTSIFASHPASGERARALEALLPQAQALANPQQAVQPAPAKR